jgi:membrane-bound serine protease (ClpP class)
MKQKILLLFLIFFLFLFSFSVNAQEKNVLTVDITGTIDQGTVEIIKESINQAISLDSEAIVLLLDTPGGGLAETFEIADLVNESQIPVIGFVYPSGSASWSAGTFILMSTHVAAMSDYTVIGSCQPVEISVEGSRLINDSKTINALVSWIETRAEMYDRNKTVAARFITENLNLNETSALQNEVIEFVSPSVNQLMIDVDGINVTTSLGEITLHTSGAEQIKYSPSIGIQLMKFFSNPALVSILFMLGIFAVIFGISTPGFGAEVFGVIAILLSLIGSGFSLPILAIIFIILGCLLLIIEIFVTPGFGVIGIGGIISLIIGSIFLIPNYTNREWLITMDYLGDLLIITIVVVALIAVFFVFLLYKILQTRKKKAAVGTFIGEKAKTVDHFEPGKVGYVRFKGELWQAISDTQIEANTKVLVVGKDESTLKIKPLKT